MDKYPVPTDGILAPAELFYEIPPTWEAKALNNGQAVSIADKGSPAYVFIGPFYPIPAVGFADRDAEK